MHSSGIDTLNLGVLETVSVNNKRLILLKQLAARKY